MAINLQIKVFSAKGADEYLTNLNQLQRERHACISIVTDDDLEPEFRNRLGAFKRFTFEDTESEQSEEDSKLYPNDQYYVPKDYPKQVIDWLKSIPIATQITTLVIHCHAGISRSSATALGVWTYYNLDNITNTTHEELVSVVDGFRPHPRHQFSPNILITRYFDEYLNANDRLNKVAKELVHPLVTLMNELD